MLRTLARCFPVALAVLLTVTCASHTHAGSRESREAREARELLQCRTQMARAGLRYAQRLEWQIGACVRQLQECAKARRSGCMTSTRACSMLAAALAAAERDLKTSISYSCRSVPVEALMRDLGPSLGECNAPELGAVSSCYAGLLREAEAMLLATANPSTCEALDALGVGEKACGSDGGAPEPPASTAPLACGGADDLACPDGFVCDRTDALCTQEKIAGRCVPASESCAAGDAVCGCDGQTYASDCARLGAGVVKQHAGACDDDPQACDFLHPECPAGSFCDLPAGDCGEGGTGVCRPMRADECNLCSAYVDGPICGCDWVTYETECDRIAAGVSTWFRGSCQ
jgi:hypothetical protein